MSAVVREGVIRRHLQVRSIPVTEPEVGFKSFLTRNNLHTPYELR